MHDFFLGKKKVNAFGFCSASESLSSVYGQYEQRLQMTKKKKKEQRLHELFYDVSKL